MEDEISRREYSYFLEVKGYMVVKPCTFFNCGVTMESNSVSKNQGGFNSVWKATLKILIIIFFLSIVKSILLRLPVIKDTSFPDLPVSLSLLTDSIIMAIIITAIFKFSFDIHKELCNAMPDFPEIGLMAKLIVLAIAVSTSYSAFLAITKIFLKDLLWIYNLVFLILIIIPLACLGMVIYKNAEKFSEFIFNKIKTITQETVRCQNCMHMNVRGSEFCKNCGEKLSFEDWYLTSGKTVSPSAQNCIKCGEKLSPASKFCIKCGQKVEVKKAAETSKKEKNCPKCGIKQKPEAVFCAECGTQLETGS